MNRKKRRRQARMKQHRQAKLNALYVTPDFERTLARLETEPQSVADLIRGQINMAAGTNGTWMLDRLDVDIKESGDPVRIFDGTLGILGMRMKTVIVDGEEMYMMDAEYRASHPDAVAESTHRDLCDCGRLGNHF